MDVFHIMFFSSFLLIKNFLTLLFISKAMVISQHSFAFLERLSHKQRIEFQNEFTRICEEIQDKEYTSKQTNDKLYDDEKKEDPFNYTVLVIYAQKNVS